MTSGDPTVALIQAAAQRDADDFAARMADSSLEAAVDVWLRRIARRGFIDRAAETALATEAIDRFAIRARGPEQIVGKLSGGNQQKVVLGKWLATRPRLLIMDEPTRGIDVGAKAEIHRLMSELAAQGLAVLMISSELPEVLGMSDRILVMHEGRISGEVPRAEANQERIMHFATGGDAAAAA